MKLRIARIMFLVLVSLVPPILSQEISNFTLRGTLASSHVNFFTGFREGHIHLPGRRSFIVNCQNQDEACKSFLIANVGQHISTQGQAIPLQLVPPRTQEFLMVDVVGNIASVRSTFFFRGVISGYTPPHVSVSGLAEFDLTVDGQIHHLVCDPLYVGCNTRIQLNIGECVAPVGEMESAGTGFVGDTLMFLWTTHIYTNQTCQ